jgi:predicted esterase
MRRPSLLAALLLGASVVPARGQINETRYELGRHLRAFEDALDAQADEAARRRGLATLKPVTTAFLSGQFTKAARVLDQARLDLASDKPAAPAVLWAQSLSVTADAHLLDAAATEVGVKVTAFYPAEGKPDKAQLRLTLLTADGKPAAEPITLDLAALPFMGKMPLKGVAEGDFVLKSEVLSDGKSLATGTQGLSFAAKLGERVDRLTAAANGLKDDKTTDRATLKRLAALLAEMRDRRPQETDYPAARLLTEAEALAKAVGEEKPYYGQKRPGSFYLALATAEGAWPARLAAPEAAAKGAPLPLVIVLHGVGASENMWFDAHGRGAAARLATERGWLVVAPREAPPAGLIDAVEKLYPVDRKRVFVIGHSLGAARAVALASKSPDTVTGVAALGGGGPVTPSEGLKNVAFFIGCGTEDFLFKASRDLKGSLEKAGVKKVVSKEYAGLEHLTVVQLGLKDVYAFFDEVAKK